MHFGLHPLLASSVIGERARPRVLTLAPSPACTFSEARWFLTGGWPQAKFVSARRRNRHAKARALPSPSDALAFFPHPLLLPRSPAAA